MPDIVSGIASGVSGLFGSLLSSINANKQMKLMREENQKNRDFNASEAQKSREFNEYMFDRTNEYNSPTQVVSRLVDAGLNPALAFGGFSNAQFGGSSAQASSSGGLSPVSPDFSGISSAGRAAVDAYNASRKTSAEVDLLESEAEKNRKETSWIDRLNSVQEKLNKVGIDVAFSTENLNNKQARYYTGLLDEVNENIELIRSNVANNSVSHDILVSEKHIKAVESKYADERNVLSLAELRSQISANLSGARLNDAQTIQVSTLLSHLVSNLDAQTRNLSADAVIKEFEGKIDNKLLSYYGVEDLARYKRDIAKYGAELVKQQGRESKSNADYKIFDTFMKPLCSILAIGGLMLK